MLPRAAPVARPNLIEHGVDTLRGRIAFIMARLHSWEQLFALLQRERAAMPQTGLVSIIRFSLCLPDAGHWRDQQRRVIPQPKIMRYTSIFQNKWFQLFFFLCELCPTNSCFLCDFCLATFWPRILISCNAKFITDIPIERLVARGHLISRFYFISKAGTEDGR